MYVGISKAIDIALIQFCENVENYSTRMKYTKRPLKVS